MDKSFAAILNDAFSEDFAPSFLYGELDSEDDLSLDVKLKVKAEISNEKTPKKEDETQHEETVMSSAETKDVQIAGNVAKEQLNDNFQQEEAKSLDKTLKDCTGSNGDGEQEGCVSGNNGEDDENDTEKGEQAAQTSIVCYNRGFCKSNKVEEQTLNPISSTSQIRNKEQGDNEAENVTYFGKLPDCVSEMMKKVDGSDEDKRDREGAKQGGFADHEQDMTNKREVIDNPCIDGPVISEKPAQDQSYLINEDGEEEYLETIKDFSGEEHQEGGESFADYPSDFSSGEYIEDEELIPDCNHQLNSREDPCSGNSVIDVISMEKAEVSDEEGDECLFSAGLAAETFNELDVMTSEKGKREFVKQVLGNAAAKMRADIGETGESDSYGPSDDGMKEKKRSKKDLENVCSQPENNKLLLDFGSESSAEFANLSTSDRFNETDPNINRNLDLITCDTLLSEDPLGSEDRESKETALSNVTQCHAEDVSACLLVQSGNARTAENLGSLDDSFFFDSKLGASGISELGQLEEDEYEDESYWEQEQERIKAFYRFHDGSDREDRRGRRQIKVQFLTNPLFRVIHYESDSSDIDSFSSIAEREDDMSSEETSEVLSLDHELMRLEESKEMNACFDLQQTQPPENRDKQDLIKRKQCSRKHKCVSMLKVTLKMVVVTVMGLLIFWLTAVKLRWFSQMLFFYGKV